MRYPEHIYSNFEIIEKDIYGEKHYGLVKHYKVLGIRFKSHLKVHDFLHIGRIDWECGRKWQPERGIIQDAINRDNQLKEYKFKRRVTK